MNKPGDSTSPQASAPMESVWDYPRPPRLEPTPRRIRILLPGEILAGQTLADSVRALRILETSHPPVYYIPTADIAMHLMRRTTVRGSFCEFKGTASYWSLDIPQTHVQPLAAPILAPDVAWSYEDPDPGYEALAHHLAFYASRIQAIGGECFVDDECVAPQPGDFYGGWITSNLRGPFKGGPGTRGW